MMRRVSVVALVWVLTGSFGQGDLTPAERADGFQPLVTGSSLAGWHVISLGTPTGTWTARDGVLTNAGDQGENWLATDALYSDFVLRLEYRTGADSDSGIFFRAPATGYPSFAGMELEIKGADAAEPPSVRTTGAIYGAAAPSRQAVLPAGEWNAVEVSVQGRHVTVTWNDQTIHDLNLDDPAYAGAMRGPLSERAARGHIGIQGHRTGAPVEFRHLRLKALDGPAPSGR